MYITSYSLKEILKKDPRRKFNFDRFLLINLRKLLSIQRYGFISIPADLAKNSAPTNTVPPSPEPMSMKCDFGSNFNSSSSFLSFPGDDGT